MMRSHTIFRARVLGLVVLVLAAAGPVPAGADDSDTEVLAIGDTLTVIQRPLVNIPALVRPGDTLTIECEAAPGTTGWAAALGRGSADIPLSIASATYDASTLWWTIEAEVPPVDLYEIYDLQVTASGGIADVAAHSVRVLPAFQDDFYFVHVTDTHLPTHLYYYQTGSDTDSSEVLDLRAVFDDIGLIDPEFVLLTGDLVNEGELEDYLVRRYYTRAQKLLGESTVPVFLSSGNHDLGGWDDTPPSDGTARRDWWRFFGWKRLNSPPAGAPARTQDYAFDYGDVHFVGLEAYINYDNWRPEIYGSDSFTSAQMTWLAGDLAAASGSAAEVLFFHYDFSNQINLASLGAEMALSGHIHRDEGSVTQAPYDLMTNNTCDGERSYRLVRVSNGVVDPSPTLSAGSTGQNLRVAYMPANDGTNDTVTATVTNTLPEPFEHGLVRFRMPPAPSYQVTGGTLEQVDHSGPVSVCYVGVAIPSGGSIGVTVTVAALTDVASGDGGLPRRPYLGAPRPNPFNPSTTFSFALSEEGSARLAVYDVRGREVALLHEGTLPAGIYPATWDGTLRDGRNAPSGVYFALLDAEGEVFARKVVLAR